MAKRKKQHVTPEQLAAVDAWYWAYINRMKLHGARFTKQRHEYQVEPMQSDARVRVQKKGAQMGFTEGEIIRTLHDMIYGPLVKGVGYLLPTAKDVSDFSKARFKPLIDDNPEVIGSHVHETDAVNIKRVGSGFLYLRGTRATQKVGGDMGKEEAAQLRSAPWDKAVFDERDLMQDEMVDEARERLGHSEVQEEVYLSTPTIPDYGIDKLYEESDQRVWMVRCQKCQKDTCLEMEFPSDPMKVVCQKSDGGFYRACIHCGAEIWPKHGRWVALYPQRDIAGWWIGQLNSLYVDPGKILKAFLDPPNRNIGEVYNSKLAMAYIAAENRLPREAVYARCGLDPMDFSSSDPTAMGVDVGALLHVVIGYRIGREQYKIIRMERVADWSDVHDLARDFNVRSGVIDLKPELHKAREFQKLESYPIFLCDYSEHIKTSPQWNLDDGVVKVNRTEICDETHALVASDERLMLPRRSAEVDCFADQVVSIVRLLQEDKVSGGDKYRYKKLRADHYRHALNYFYLAAKRLPVCSRFGPRSVKPAFTNNSFVRIY